MKSGNAALLSLGLSFLSAAGAAATVEELRARAAALVAKMTVAEKCAQLRNSAPEIRRLGVHRYNWWNEALHGVARNGRATVFPQPIGMAASFDPDLVREVASAIADEGRAKYAASAAAGRREQYTGLTFWSPNVNIFRDPRWGRGIETWGEDPYLTGRMGVAFIRGLQGDDPVYLKTAACAKHFAVHSGPEAKRHTFDVRPSAKDFRETYLPAFEACVRDGRVEAVMGAYNRVYGESASANRLLLKDILRGEWGFAGHVVSDCGAVCDIWRSHKIVKTPPEAAGLAIRNGLTFECGPCFQHLAKAIEAGHVTEAEVDEALVTLFTTRYRLGIMESDPDCPYNAVDPSCVCSAAHRELARKMARESMVLVKNDGVLPLDPDHGSYAVLGAGASDIFALMGNYYGVSDRYVSYLEGISAAVDPGVSVFYHPAYSYGQGFGRNCHGGDVLVMVLGLTNSYEGEEGESFASEANGDRVSLKLPENQLACLRKFQDARRAGRRILTVVTGGSPVELREVEELSDAVVLAWYGGEEGGTALADLVFGRADFTGRLPVTFPDSADVLPPFEDYSMAGRTYRYQTKGVTHPFGYGLSYAKMEVGKVERVAKDEKGETVRVTVKNVGARAGVAVVQLYVSTPNAGRGAPLKSLVGFVRVPLAQGEQKPVDFKVSPRQLMEFGEDGVARRVPGECRYSVQL